MLQPEAGLPQDLMMALASVAVAVAVAVAMAVPVLVPVGTLVLFVAARQAWYPDNIDPGVEQAPRWVFFVRASAVGTRALMAAGLALCGRPARHKRDARRCRR